MSVNHETVEALRQVAQIPTESRLWSIATIAEYCELSASHVAQKIVCRPDFPKAIRVGGVGKPRWRGREVMRWFDTWES